MLELIVVFGIVCFYFVCIYAITPNGTEDPVSNHYVKVGAFIMGLMSIILLLWVTFTTSTTSTQEIQDGNGTIIGYKTETVELTGGAVTIMTRFWKLIVILLATLVFSMMYIATRDAVKLAFEKERVKKGHLPRDD